MVYKNDIIDKMKEIILLENIEERFKITLLSYINEKSNSAMSFGELCVFHYQAFSQEPEIDRDIIRIAAAVELLVLSFDIIDDLQDGDADYIWCNNPAIAMNGALAMIFLTAKLIHESTFQHKAQALHVLNEFAIKSINGQYLDLENSAKDEASYLKMTEAKSGALIALSSSIGASLALGKLDERVIEYSTYIGVVQQILNDIQDLKTWGKKNDLLNRKYSLPILYLLEQSEAYADILKKYYNGAKVELEPTYFKQVLLESGAINYALAIKNIFKFKTLHIIKTMPFNNEEKQYLIKLVE
ncbi:polyprenyl synthetase family protein [Metasolibacillus sp. FSL K6-0083]|uniref:polyprenyl synthetase family protein n=1 Tax=Metasolibacillus sp. FSL K6-0083 TaxID=2921416 RepID=UPI00315AD6BF